MFQAHIFRTFYVQIHRIKVPAAFTLSEEEEGEEGRAEHRAGKHTGCTEKLETDFRGIHSLTQWEWGKKDIFVFFPPPSRIPWLTESYD